MTPAPQTEDLIAQLEKALQLWAEAESAKSNKLWQTEEDALRTLQVAMYDFWKPANLRTLLDSYRTAERALICAPAECGPGCEDHECPYTHSPLTWEQHAKNMEADYVTAKARAEAAESALSREVERMRHISTNQAYMLEAYRNMLGEKGLAVVAMWDAKRVKRVHFDWGDDARKMTGEERAAFILELEAAPKTLVESIDHDQPTVDARQALEAPHE